MLANRCVNIYTIHRKYSISEKKKFADHIQPGIEPITSSTAVTHTTTASPSRVMIEPIKPFSNALGVHNL